MTQTQAKQAPQLSIIDKAIFTAFGRWINANPQGGIFEYHDFKVKVLPKK